MTELRVGDEVRYRPGWGFDAVAPYPVRIVGIELDEARYGSLPWNVVSDPLSGVFVDLDNGTWAYGDQLVAPTEGRSSR